MTWRLSSSFDRHALDIVDGTGPFEGRGPHYSRRTPGSKSFVGCGREVVLVTDTAVWACVYQKTPAPRGSGSSRGREGQEAPTRWLWRNMLFRNLGPELSSDLIRSATIATYEHWIARYGELPEERLRTEVDPKAVRSTNPGFCYKLAGWVPVPVDPEKPKRTKLYFWAPER